MFFLVINVIGLTLSKLGVLLKGNRVILGLEPVLTHTEKSCIASYYRKLSTNIKIIIIENTNTSFVSLGMKPLEDNKTEFNLIIYYLNFSRKAVNNLYNAVNNYSQMCQI